MPDHMHHIERSILLIQGCLVPLIAVITVYIAWQQAKTSRAQYRLNLYAKRYAVYETTRCLLREIVKNGRFVESPIAEEFWHKVECAEFLFGKDKDVVIFLRNLRKKHMALACQTLRLRTSAEGGLPEGDERKTVAMEQQELMAWFMKQLDQLSVQFYLYLKCAE